MAEYPIPPRLESIRSEPGGGDWLDRLPGIVEHCVETWALRLAAPFPDGNVSLAIPATQADGAPAVLKLQYPHRESEHEADALAHWHGDGAIRLIAHDAGRHALLLERCVPGAQLDALPPDEALGVMIELLPRLWKPAAAPFRPLAEEANWWAGYLEKDWTSMRQPYDRRLLDAALDAFRTLPATQGEQVLVHQDLHAQNVLRAERMPWLAIDPKPLAGEREFSLAPIIRSSELGHSRAHVLRRLDRLTDQLSLDRERARLWALGQTVAWCSDSGSYRERHIETATWLLQAGR